jgi:hypothetical protein
MLQDHRQALSTFLESGLWLLFDPVLWNSWLDFLIFLSEFDESTPPLPKKEKVSESCANFIQTSKISRLLSITIIPTTTKITFIVSVVLAVLDPKEPPSHFSQLTIPVKQGNSFKSYVKQINLSTPNWLIWQDSAVEVEETPDMDMVEVVVVVEVLIPNFYVCANFVGGYRGAGRTGANNMPVGGRRW